MPFPVNNIADKIILTQTDFERGEVITNLKLQKLLYYVQGYHLAFFNEQLFQENLEAWTYGPVSPDVYHRFKDSKSMAIVLDSDYKPPILANEQEDMFSQVMHEYGKFSAIKLMEMTHKEKPWLEAFEKDNKVINPETMKQYFKTLLDEQ